MRAVSALRHLTALSDVRFWGQSGHESDITECPLLTQSGHPQHAFDDFPTANLTSYDAST